MLSRDKDLESEFPGLLVVILNHRFIIRECVTVDFLTHKRVRNKDHQPQYFIRNTHPAIISEEDWYAVHDQKYDA